MGKTKINSTYQRCLRARFKVLIIGIIMAVVMIGVVYFFKAKQEYAEKNGIEVLAVVTDIDEVGNPLHDRFMEDRQINKVYVEYAVDGKKCTATLGSYTNTIGIGDEVSIYVVDGNTSHVVSSRGTGVLGVLIIFFSIALVAMIISFFKMIKIFNFYKRANNFDKKINAKFVTVEAEKKFLEQKNTYYVICESSELDGFERRFKSHEYNINPTSVIQKKNMESFSIKINSGNLDEYVVDVNKLDKIIYS